METFRKLVARLRWTGERLEDYVVGYEDRFEKEPLEMPLLAFLSSEVPEHRARYVRRVHEVIWDRRRSG